MNYKAFIVNPIEENCYILWDEVTHEGAIIDCGAWKMDEFEEIRSFIVQQNIHLRYALQTHCHFDHIWGAGFVHDTFGLSIMCHENEVPIYASANEMVQHWFRISMPENMPHASNLDTSLTENTPLPFAGKHIQIIETPGHTPGGISFYIPEARLLLSGDTLFYMSIGRTDLPGGSYNDIMKNITSKLLILPEDTVVLPGHGPSTTVGEEKSILL